METGKTLHSFIAHQDKVYDITFSPDGKLLASSSWDGTVLLWDLAVDTMD